MVARNGSAKQLSGREGVRRRAGLVGLARCARTAWLVRSDLVRGAELFDDPLERGNDLVLRDVGLAEIQLEAEVIGRRLVLEDERLRPSSLLLVAGAQRFARHRLLAGRLAGGPFDE